MPENMIEVLYSHDWVRESDNDLRMDMKMMIIDDQSLPENIHAVVFINDNHTARLLGGSGKLPIF